MREEQVAASVLEQNWLSLYGDLNDLYSPKLEERLEWRRLTTFAPNRARPVHNWFYCAQAFSSELVNRLLELFSVSASHTVLDPFCGVGTTLLSCSEKGIRSIGCDIFPLFCFVTKVKCEANYDIEDLKKSVDVIVKTPTNVASEIPKHPLFHRAFSQRALKELLSYRDRILRIGDEKTRDFLLLALLSTVNDVSYIRKAGAHYRFINTNRTGVRHQYGKMKMQERSVVRAFKQKAYNMIGDLESRERNLSKYVFGDSDSAHYQVADVHITDARSMRFLESDTIDVVITSPPYLNRDNYVAQYKLELFLAPPPYGVKEFDEYRTLTFRTLRSHVEAKEQQAYKAGIRIKELDLLVDELRSRELSYRSIPEMVEGYFEDMAVVFGELSRVVKKGGKLAIIVGNVRFGGVHIPVDLLLARIAEDHGFDVEKIVVARYKMNSPQQMKRYGKVPVRESVVVLQK